MKKFSVLIIALIMCIVSLSALVGCNKSKNESGYDVLYDFEDVGRNLYQLETHMNFGKISINEDADFVSEGKISYKLQPIGYFGTKVRPVLVLPTDSSDYDYNYMDFTKYEAVEFDIYNAQSVYLDVDVGLTYSRYQSDSTKSTYTGGVEQNILLKPGWNNVKYKILHDYINIRGDANYIYGVSLAFANSGSMDLEDSNVFYIDNVRLKKLKTDYVPNEDFNLECDEEKGVFEIAYFNNLNQKHFFNLNKPAYRWLHPSTEIVVPDNSTSGNAIKMVTQRDAGIDNGSGPTQQGVGTIDLEGKVIKQAYENACKNAGNVEYEYFFCFDAFNLTSDITFGLKCRFTGIDDEWAQEGLLEVYDKLFQIAPNKWTSFEYNLSIINTKNGEKTEMVDGKNQTVDTVGPYLENIGAARLYFPTNTVDNREFLVDNFRIERRVKV